MSDDDAVWLDEHRRIVREIEVERDVSRDDADRRAPEDDERDAFSRAFAISRDE